MSTDSASLARGEIAGNLRTFSARLIVHSLLASEALGLTGMDLVCMCLLQLEGPATPGWLAERTGLTASAITGVVDRLERAAYVSRGADPHDRRRVIVAPHLARFNNDLDKHTSTRSPIALDFLTSYSPAQLRIVRHFFTDIATAASPPNSSASKTSLDK